jgi:uncharacterized protein (UPF0332 family)
MTDKIDENSRQSLIEYRLTRAKETLNEADIMIANERYNAAVNRLYYGLLLCSASFVYHPWNRCFYA